MIIKRLFRYVFPTEQAIRCRPWFKANGDKTMRLDYPQLNNESIIMDLGGYEGQWASDIFSKYCSNIYIFEPYKPYAEAIEFRFNKNDKIKVFALGLGKSNSKELLNISADGSSIFKGANNSNSSEIEIVEAATFFKQHNINSVDLMKINIEGGEYDLLENLIGAGLISKIADLQIQFHDFAPNAHTRMKDIQNELSKTHELTYQYEFVWENWKLKQNN